MADWRNDVEKWFHAAAGLYFVYKIIDQDPDYVAVGKAALQRFECFQQMVEESCESPIEAIFLAYALFCIDGYNEVECDLFPGQFEPKATTRFAMQQSVGKFRVDFLFTVNMNGKDRHLVVECDGHDFHERTKEQAARDKSRDRDMLKAGAQVMRFTGSEIYRDPVKCIEEVETVLSGIVDLGLVEMGLIRGSK